MTVPKIQNNSQTEVQKLLEMDEKTFFAESTMFMLSKMMGLATGKTSGEEYLQSQALVDGMLQMRKLAPYLNKPLPKYPERGWLFPYLIEGDRKFSSGRWDWWTDCLLAERIEGPIPQIKFRTTSSDKDVEETIKHIEDILIKLETMGTGSSLMTLVDWILWGLGSKNIEEYRCPEKIGKFLYEKFELGRLQIAPFDYFAYFAQATRGNGRWGNPTSFFQTPPNVIEMMTQMVFHDSQDITQSFCEPCAGTGTMLLFASNNTVNLYAQEICLDLVRMCELNGYLYVPWLIKPAPWLKVSKIEDIPLTSEKKKVVVGERQIELQNKNGQILMFDM